MITIIMMIITIIIIINIIIIISIMIISSSIRTVVDPEGQTQTELARRTRPLFRSR